MRSIILAMVVAVGTIFAGAHIADAHHINPNIDRFGNRVNRAEARSNLQRQRLLAQRQGISVRQFRQRNVQLRQRVQRQRNINLRQNVTNNTPQQQIVNNNRRQRLIGNGQLVNALNQVLIRDADGNTAIGNFAAGRLANEINGSDAAQFVDANELGGVINGFINALLAR